MIRVIELFAGVGGFRAGLDAVEGSPFETVWFNQWEPGKSDRSQHAWATYCRAFGEDELEARRHHTNTSITEVVETHFKSIPDHDLLVGGFPCQDYSVAKTLSTAKGLEGKKGVLWWDIYKILLRKDEVAPRFLMLENVDRLLKSPATQRGRDFAVMLSSLNQLGYAVEWRVINAADYGMPQRRRRVYILGYRKDSPEYKAVASDMGVWMLKQGVFAKAFPTEQVSIPIDLFPTMLRAPDVETAEFNLSGGASPFENAGVMVDGCFLTIKMKAISPRESMTLGEVLEPIHAVPSDFFLSEAELSSWRHLKGGKAEKRRSKSGFEYEYTEGPVAFPDPLDKPSRTIVTGEGGSTPSRFKHVVNQDGRLRRLLPVELERLNMFPDGHTAGATDTQRAFFMGNALVVGIVTRLGREIARRCADADVLAGTERELAVAV